MDTEKLRFKVKIPNGDILEYEVSPSDTILSLLRKLKEVVGVDEKDQLLGINQLLYKSPTSRVFHPNCTFAETVIKNDDTLDLNIRAGGCRLFVKTLGGQAFELDADTRDAIWKIKELIQEQAGHPVEKQKIVFAGKELEDHRTVADYGMQKDSTMHLVLKS